jgi:hypothetical protein
MAKSFIQSILALPFSKRQKRLLARRAALSSGDFIRQICAARGDKAAAEIIYAKLQDWIFVEGFTPYPNDSLCSIFGIAEEELDEDIILDILNQLNLLIPSPDLVAGFGPIDTPAEIARLISESR